MSFRRKNRPAFILELGMMLNAHGEMQSCAAKLIDKSIFIATFISPSRNIFGVISTDGQKKNREMFATSI